jgi:hypothetical protein
MRHVVTYDWILVSLHAVCGCAWRDIDGDEPAASVTKRARALQYVMTRVPYLPCAFFADVFFWILFIDFVISTILTESTFKRVTCKRFLYFWAKFEMILSAAPACQSTWRRSATPFTEVSVTFPI